jgi:hypothetical protein
MLHCTLNTAMQWQNYVAVQDKWPRAKSEGAIGISDRAVLIELSARSLTRAKFVHRAVGE